MAGDKPAKDPTKANQRGAARLAAVQALYQMDVGRAPFDATVEQFRLFHLGKEVEGEEYLPADEDYFKQILDGVRTYQVKIDPIVDNSLVEGWPVTRIDSTLRAILRSAAFEMLYKKKTFRLVSSSMNMSMWPMHSLTRISLQWSTAC